MKIKNLIIVGISVAVACTAGLVVFGAMKIVKALKPKVHPNQELVEDIVRIRGIE